MVKLSVSKNIKYKTIVKFIPEKSRKIDDFEGKKGEITVRYEKNITIIYCGLGDKKTCSEKIVRTAAANAIRKATTLKRKQISLIDPKLKGYSSYAILEGATLATYSFSKYLTKEPTLISTIEFVSEKLTAKDVKKIKDTATGVFLTRDLINTNAHEVYPETLAKEAKKIATSSSAITCTVLSEKDIEKKGLGLLGAVGQGSIYPPRLIILKYIGDKKNKNSKAIIGKGITFDSGGQNLKPSGSIETMKCDMSGAATVLGIFSALASLKPKTNVIGVIAAAQNAIGSKAYFPGDIYKAYNGKTVEIKNTDAEGRLALADALAYCQKNFKPTEMIDLATLTGAIIVSLGALSAGIFGNNDKLINKLIKSGETCSEHLWNLPLTDYHRDAVKGDISDLRNLSKLPPRHAGSSTAAAFLNAFVEDNLPWAHLDIAGTAYNEQEANGETPKYATGFGVRLLLEYLID